MQVGYGLVTNGAAGDVDDPVECRLSLQLLAHPHHTPRSRLTEQCTHREIRIFRQLQVSQ
jgi:hypothetical protein